MTNEQVITRIKHNSMYKDDRDTADYIIKALEQQPCDDCVSREQAIVQLSIDLSEIELPRIKDSLDKLPPVIPTQSWILIERRDLTQEEKEFYSSLYGDEPEYMIESRMPNDGEEVLVSAGGIVFKDNFSRDDFDFENISIDEIDAWMPLPQPYKES
ncbi:MAG: hypothetical protein J6Y02_17620 [Pseudobutyrivibrio sp.]|nr:hypothetical protein [Pseudobutyrivibrio sp.]